MNFETFAKTPWILPGPGWIALPIVVVLALRLHDFRRVASGAHRHFWFRWGFFFGITTALDAYLNGAWSPFASDSVWATVCGVAFVYLGDLRFFSAALWDGRKRSLVAAFLLSWITPVVTQGVRALLPHLADVPRRTYLLYECIFVIVLAALTVLAAVVRRHTTLSRLSTTFARRLALFFAAQYVLWILADVVLLGTGHDLGYALRMVPDILYYGIFVSFVLVLARSADDAEA
jgi:hypothetical protein